MHEVLVNRLGGLSLPRKSVVRLTDRPDMTLDVYRGRKTTMQQEMSHTVGMTSFRRHVPAEKGPFYATKFCQSTVLCTRPQFYFK